MRVFLLQPEEQRTGECARYGDSARVVLGVVDGGGLFRYLGALVCLFAMDWRGLVLTVDSEDVFWT